MKPSDKLPRDPAANVVKRDELAKLGASDPRMAEHLKQLCRDDPIFYLNAFCWTFDPRLSEGEKINPFITYPFQERSFLSILEHVRQSKPLVIEKSRDMGATWLCLYAFLYLCHFHRGYSFLVLSKKGDAASKAKDSDSLFWKMLFQLKYLPDWLRPTIDSVRGHIGFPDTESMIDAETSVQEAGVGGRRSAILFDEFARFPDAATVYKGTIDTARCRIFNFTPWGSGNKAYELSKAVKEGLMDGLRMHWSEHPVKAAGLYQWHPRLTLKLFDPDFTYSPEYDFVRDGKLRSPWYDTYCRELNDQRAVAENLDIDYLASKYQYYNAEKIRDLIEAHCCPPYWEGDILRGELKKVEGGPLKLWITLRPDGTIPPSRYCIGGDISHGVGATPSCLSIVDAMTGEKVGCYVSANIEPRPFADLAVALCHLFRNTDAESSGPAKLCWEKQGPGVVFGKRIAEIGFPNVWRSTSEHNQFSKESDIPGWSATPETKLTLHSDYRAAISSGDMVNRDKASMEETLQYTYQPDCGIDHDGKVGTSDPTAGKQNHGDRVVADALAWKVALERKPRIIEKVVDPKLDPPPLSPAWRKKWRDRQSLVGLEWL